MKDIYRESMKERIENIYNLSPMQEGILFHHLYDQGEDAYVVQLILHLSGKLDEKYLEESCCELLNRHQVLRTVFIHDKLDKPRQVVLKERENRFFYQDLRRLAAEEKEIFIRDYLSEDRANGFSLSKGPLIRFSLLREGDERHSLIITLHHIIMDGWGIGLLVKDLLAFYREKVTGYEGVPGPVYPYSNYIKWLESLDKEEALAYWKDYLTGYETAATVVPGMNNGKQTGYHRLESIFNFSKGITVEINKLARQLGVTVNNIFQAVWGVILQGYNNSEDIVFGNVISGRSGEVKGIEEIIGLLSNVVPLRVHLKKVKSFRALAVQIHNEFAGIEKYGFLSIPGIQACGETEGELINHLFAFENYPLDESLKSGKIIVGSGIRLEEIKEIDQTHYDFNIMVLPGEELHVKLQYNGNVIENRFIEAVSGHIHQVIHEVLENPDREVKYIEIITAQERVRIIEDFNDTTAAYPHDRTILELFAEQAARRPDSVAVVGKGHGCMAAWRHGGVHITYRELNRRSNQLAHRLISRGVGPDTIVGIMMAHSIEMMVGIFGILKSCAAYLPIDPDYPEKRSDYILKDSGAKVLLAALAVQVKKKVESIEIIDISKGVSSSIAALPTTLSRISPTDLAYIIYTSGSTGNPRGVMVQHRSLCNLCSWHNDYYSITSRDRAAKYAGFCFDASVWEIFPYLIAGSALYIVPDEIKLDMHKLDGFFQQHAVTVAFLPTQVCERFMELENTGLRLLLTGGDKLKTYIKRSYTLYNNYGPTENTVVATSCLVNRRENNIPIGKPIFNTRVYILNKTNLQLQPPGVHGELCITGESLARGYLNNPELTAGKFVQDLWDFYDSHDGYHRSYITYRTGDLARWLWDGNIEFLGRIDYQVKIRGYRVELAEIENQLLLYPGIKEAVVTAGERKSGDRYLSLYFAVDKEEEIAAARLREYLSGKLPDFMIPTYFIRLEKLPLTASGKIDRRALPQPGKDVSREIDEGYAAPGNEIEASLALIWERVLEIDDVGINDNFFEVGGHSLKAISVVSMIHRELQKEISIRDIFDYPTIKQLGELLGEAENFLYRSVEPVEEVEYYPVSSEQKRMYILDQFEGARTAYNLPGMVMIRGHLETKRLENVFIGLIRRHETLRTFFQLIDDDPVQCILNYKDVDFKINYMDAVRSEYLEQDIESGSDEDIRVQELFNEFVRPFDLRNDVPLMRVGLIKLSVDKHVLMLDMHHIISDGVSMSTLIEEFGALYEGKVLPGLRIQYKDYSLWQNKLLKKGLIKTQKEYWLKRFLDEIPLLNLSTDFARPAIQSFEGDRIGFRVGKEVEDQIKAAAAKTKTTLYMILLAAFNVLLAKYTGQEDIIVGTPVSGRPSADLVNIIGLFVNTLAMRNYPCKEKRFSSFLEDVKENTLEAFENQEFQFEDLVDSLDLRRDLSRNPVFDVMLSVQSMDIKEIMLPGLNVVPYEPDNYTSKFDMALYAAEEDGEISLNIEYCTKLFKKATIKRIASHYAKILSRIAANLEIKIIDIDILTDREKRAILYDFNDSSLEYPENKTVQQLFEDQVEKTPDRMAVVDGDNRITLRELNRRANQLGSVLRQKGVKPEDIVGIMIDHSVEMIIGIFAVLKAGGAYLPIDSKTPVKRINRMLDNSRSSILLTLRNIFKKSDYSFTYLQGLHQVKQNPVITPARPYIEDLDSLPIPDRSFIDCEKYSRFIGQALFKNTISMMGTRGCPFNCAYCHKIWQKKQLVRSYKNIFEELQIYYRMGIRRFVFFDDLFNLDVDNSSKFFDLIVKNRMNVQLSFGMRGDILTRDYIDLMVEAGVTRLALALETASPRIQKLIKKNLHLDKFRSNIEYICKKYPHVIMDLNTMHGFPTETGEEAMMTLDYIKSIKWLHFPYIHILKIFPNTAMEKIAVENGISRDAIYRSTGLAFHELPETLPFDKRFTSEYQSRFLDEYFLSKERLCHVLPHQMKALTEDEILQKYNSYLPVDIRTFEDLLEFTGIDREELGVDECLKEENFFVPNLNEKVREYFPAKRPLKNALRVLLLDLTQLFSSDSGNMLYNVVEAPLGLMYLMAYLNKEYGDKINGKIAKSLIDFDSYHQLKKILEEFQADIIGIRSISFFKNFFHEAIGMIRNWGIKTPIIAGGPYATSEFLTILQDRNVNLVVLGEGEITFSQLIHAIMQNGGQLPGWEVLKEIPGLGFRTNQKPVTTSGFAREIIILDELQDHLAKQPGGNLPHINRPTDLVYNIHTSGSTGTPRGVLIENRSLYNLVLGLKDRIYKRYHHSLNVCLVSPFIFDASVKQIFAALLNGHSLHIVPDHARMDGECLWEFYEKYRIDISDGTPTHLRLLSEAAESCWKNNRVVRIKEFIIGGEVLSKKIARNFFNRFDEPSPGITNVYGPTECCVDTTLYEVSKENINLFESVPIGRPMPNYHVYIVDKEEGNRLQPVGVPGELCIGGAGVARGYLNQPELTAGKFLLVSHMSYISKKLYKTGDLACWLPDGNIEILGRIDRQVKIRGYRIELAEIQSLLLNIAGIREALVVAKEDKAGDQFLCAYFTAGRELSPSATRKYLTEYLPDYMIPRYFLQIQQMPLAPGGKIDTKNLPDPEIKLAEDYQVSRDRVEKKLVDIWADVLDIKEEIISIDSNFFELGGHSLKAVTMTARIHKVFDVKLHLAEVFKNPTVREMARCVRGTAIDSYISLEPVEKKEYYKLSSQQKRLYFLQQLNPDITAYNVPNIMQLGENLEIARLGERLNQLIIRHASLRTSFTMVNNEPVQRIHDEGEVGFIIDYFESHGQDLDEIIRNFTRPFDLGQAPLLRVGIIRTDTSSPLMIINIHHIVTDGTSMDILVRDLLALQDGEILPGLRLQYNDYAQWQNTGEYRQFLEDRERYWLNIFPDQLPILNLPADYPRPVLQSFEGHTLRFMLNETETQTLKDLAKLADATLYMTILAIFNILLAKLGGQEDIIIGTPIAARHYAELESIMGMFVNTLAIRNYPEGAKRFDDFLREVKDRTVAAYDNQEYQFEDLVDHVSVTRDTSRNPVFDVVFSFHNEYEQSKYYSSHEKSAFSTAYEVKHNLSRFDLTLHAVEIDSGIICLFEYCTKLFKESTIERFIKYFKQIIKSIVERPGQQLSGIEIITQEEKEAIFKISRGMTQQLNPPHTIRQLFEEKVGEIPQQIAVVWNDRAYSYEELNRRANQLEGILIEQGVRQGSIVGIIMERSFEMIAAILAVLKAGGAYLPIDIDYPIERIGYMLKDSSVSLILTQKHIFDSFSILSLKNIEFQDLEPLITVTPARPPLKCFDDLPLPNRTLIDYEKYHCDIGIAMAKHTVSIQATRGCPYKCVFCHRLWPKRSIIRSADNIFREIRQCYDAGVTRFVFIDDIFNLHVDTTTQLLEKIIKHNLDIQLFFSNGLRGDILSKDYIDLMIAAGTVNIDMALESASPRIQKLVRKNLNLEKFKENMQYIAHAHPHVMLEMESIIGFPGETEEEALMTLEFMKSIQWIHFPNLNILKIFPNTDMYRLAIENGVSEEKIKRSVNLAYHELPDTLPFSKDFVQGFQARFLNEYFLSGERLLHVLPYQMKNFSEAEIIRKYDSYLPADINCFSDILELGGISVEQFSRQGYRFLPADYRSAPRFNERIESYFPVRRRDEDAFRVLLIDLSLLFSTRRKEILYNVVEAPLGLMYLVSYLDETFGERVCGKVIKSGIDFDSFAGLKQIVQEFKPDLVGLRTLSLYRDFFHQTVLMLRQWGLKAPVIAGGPHATAEYELILQDKNVDLIVLGEGELTLAEIVGKMIENHKQLPGEEVLREIAGIAFLKDRDETLKRIHSREILLVDELSGSGELVRYPVENLEKSSQGSDLLYVIYTSGSTGTPKGVMLEQLNLVNLIAHQQAYTNIDFSRVLQFTTIGFDVASQEIFSTLISGGKLYLVDRETIQDVPKLLGVIDKHEIKTLFLPASFLKFIFNEDELIKDFPGGVRHIVSAGEQLVVGETFRQYLQKNGVYLHNQYGPTETHVVTALTLAPGGETPELPAIGRPLINTGIHILDNADHLMPVGIAGELCISGIQVGKGYLNNPELTAEKFIESRSYSSHRTYILYRTGDLARWLPDGNIEFLGRKDLQVKIRGFRIEPGEIETRLLEYAGIKEVVVLAKGEESEDRYLCAYFVPGPGRTPEVSELRQCLAKQLPDYMVPAFFISIDQIPLTPNRKVDRNKLPVPGGHSGEEHTLPRDDLEKKLVQIWSEVLGIGKDSISIDANFFELGGHSLKAVTLVSMIHKQLEKRIMLKDIFENATIRYIGELLKGAGVGEHCRQPVESKAAAALEPCEEREYYPLSSAQKRLYILDQVEGGKLVYNLPGILMFSGVPDKKRLENVFKTIIGRHETLRTSFQTIGTEVVQRVMKDVDFNLSYIEAGKGIDKIDKSSDEDTKLRDIFHTFVQPFDLKNGPSLFKAGLVKLSGNKYAFMFDMHHIISDGVSMGIIIEELAALYEGNPLPPLRLQYKDYALWQTGTFKDSAIKKQEEYWLKCFWGELPVLNLPTDFARPNVQDFTGDRVFFSVAAEIESKIFAMVSRTGATLYMVLLAAFNVLLSRYTGQEDIVVGSPVAGRVHADLGKTIGMFVNTLVMRNFPGSHPNFGDFLEQVKGNALEAFENQEYPFEELVNRLNLPWDMSRNPVFDVFFGLQNVDIDEIVLPGLTVESFAHDRYISKFDLSLYAAEESGRIKFSFEYCTKLFKRETIRQMAIQFETLLHWLTENPGAAFRDIDVISREEKQEILYDFNDTCWDYSRNKTIHQLFEAQVEKTPDNRVVIFADKYLTYSVLNEKADQLARILQERKVRTGSIVGIMMERSLEMIIGIFAILKAGAVYLPIHPGYPEKRIKYILEDSGSKFFLTAFDFADFLLNGEAIFLKQGGFREDKNRDIATSSTNTGPMYVIYTSGSTGKPKGVMIENKSVVNRLNWMQRCYPINPDDIILQKTSITFDVSIWELFWWSFRGAAVCLLKPGYENDPKEIAAAIERNRITTMHFVPSMLNVFLNHIDELANLHSLHPLKRVFASGEALTLIQVEQFNASLNSTNGTKLINLYGPTEATVDVSYFNCSMNEKLEKVPIGKPIDNIRLYIVDQNFHLQPIGIVGELCIAGDGLARGYLNRPELTAERYCYQSYRTYCPEKIYKTGDLARWLPDGNIEFLGRIDHQVKIRGFRIELGEIESHLLKYESIREVVVIAKDIMDSGKNLCAYIVSQRDIHAAELKDYLAQLLPYYMIPTYFTRLGEIPLTSNGKVNRKLLPTPEVQGNDEYVPPRNQLEEKMIDIVAEVLGIEKDIIGIDTKFFDIGGNSLNATILVTKIYKELNVELKILDIFANPTIRKLSSLIEVIDWSVSPNAGTDLETREILL
ncbi:amino acid adenylation domain-containing protein [Acidobacteriota bacterium]